MKRVLQVVTCASISSGLAACDPIGYGYVNQLHEPSALFITSAAASGVSLSQPASIGHLSLATGAASGTTSWIRTGTSLPASPR